MAVVYGKEASIWKVRPARPPAGSGHPRPSPPRTARRTASPTSGSEERSPMAEGNAWLGPVPCPAPHPCSAPNSDPGLLLHRPPSLGWPRGLGETWGLWGTGGRGADGRGPGIGTPLSGRGPGEVLLVGRLPAQPSLTCSLSSFLCRPGHEAAPGMTVGCMRPPPPDPPPADLLVVLWHRPHTSVLGIRFHKQQLRGLRGREERGCVRGSQLVSGRPT